MSAVVVLDDHLLRDVLTDRRGQEFELHLGGRELATTNLFYVRLCKSALGARGKQLTGGWPVEQRQALARTLMALPGEIQITPIKTIAFRMAEVGNQHRVSTLGAEAVAAAENLGAELWVWEGDDGPGIRSACTQMGIRYRTIAH